MTSPGPRKNNQKRTATSAVQKSTSWGAVAPWYHEHLEKPDTYHEMVIKPNLLRVVNSKGLRILDLACGEGYLTRALEDAGAIIDGADIAAPLVALAEKSRPRSKYYVASADKLFFAANSTYDVVTCTLALQNMEHLEPVIEEVSRVLKPGGRFVAVINHPSFRIPHHSSWGWDEKTKRQYRRIDAYLSAKKEKMEMTPGTEGGRLTISFHRSLQDHMKTFAKGGLSIIKIEEWISHRTSEKGPRTLAEDFARKEFPLFMMIELKKFV